MTKTQQCPLPSLPVGGHSRGKEDPSQAGEGPRKALELEALGPLALDVKLVPVVLASPQVHRPGAEASGLLDSDPGLGVSPLTGNPTSSTRGI